MATRKPAATPAPTAPRLPPRKDAKATKPDTTAKAEPEVAPTVSDSKRIAEDLGDDDVTDFGSADIDPEPVVATAKPVAPTPTAPPASTDSADTDAPRTTRAKRKPETKAEKLARLQREAAETPEERDARLKAEIAALQAAPERGSATGEPLRSNIMNKISARATSLQGAINALSNGSETKMPADRAAAICADLKVERDAAIKRWLYLSEQRALRHYDDTKSLRTLQFKPDGAGSFIYTPTPRTSKDGE